MKFERLGLKHTEQLLAFELENKAWFESLIAARAPDTYTTQGIEKHVQNFLTLMKREKLYSLVLIDEENIIARANLKEINYSKNSAYIGYRVAKAATGQGIASLCVKKLCEVSEKEFQLTQLNALVLDNNPASCRVLIKNGFSLWKHLENFEQLHGVQYGCSHFRKSLI